MSDYEVGKDIGALIQRVEYLETALFTAEPSSEFEDYAHRLAYPITGKVTANTDTNKNLCRAVQESTYTVELLKTNDGIPTLMKSEMTRAELDDFIAKNPGRNFSEFIVSVSPSYKDYI
jgi:hypothetical protein